MAPHKAKADWNEVEEYFTFRPHCPIRRLIANIIQRGVFDTFALEPHLQHEAECWCYSDSTEPWSIHWCMDQIDQLPSLPRLRQRIPELRKLAADRSDSIYGENYFETKRRNAENKFKAERQSWRTRAGYLSE